jgi:serine/threonine-protein kinase
MSDFAGRTLGQYQLERLIGKGGMAEVYSAHQVNLSREVAIKVIKPDLIEDAEFLDRFKREVQLLSKLEHPNIVPVIDGGEDQGVVYLVMRYIKGGGLHQKLRAGRLDLNLAAKMLVQIGGALTYAHTKADIVHRDMKPSNVLLDDADNAYLTDFGIAKLLAGTTKLTASNTVLGTPAYMSPEQWRGEGLSATADIYSLGIMAFEMVTGRLPYEGDTSFTLMYKHFNELPPNPRDLITSLPESLELVLLKAIAKNPDERFQSAEEFGEAFRAAVESRVVEIARPASKGGMENRTPPPMPIGPATIPLDSDTGRPTNNQASPTMMTGVHAKRDLPWLLVALAVLMIIVGVGLGVFLSTQSDALEPATLPPTTVATLASPTPLPANNANQGNNGPQQAGPPMKDATFPDYDLTSRLVQDWIDPVAQKGYYQVLRSIDGRGPQMAVLRGEPKILLESGLYTVDDAVLGLNALTTLERIALFERFTDGYTIQSLPGYRFQLYHLQGFSSQKSRNADYFIMELPSERAVRDQDWLIILATHPPDNNYSFFQQDVLQPFLQNLALAGDPLFVGGGAPHNSNINGGNGNGGRPNGPQGQEPGQGPRATPGEGRGSGQGQGNPPPTP